MSIKKQSIPMNILISIFILLTFLSTACLADNSNDIQPVRSSPSPGVTEIHNIQYVPRGDAAQTLDLYIPTQASAKPLPLVVWIHGGGWEGGSKDWCYPAPLVAHGYAVASVEYRFSQKAVFPAQIQDCQAAIRWLRANSKAYNLDPRHIGVGGDSAGGHLASLVGTSGGSNAFPPIGGNADQSDRVEAVLDVYGPSDFSAVVSQAAADKTKNVYDFNHGDPYSSLIGVPLGSDPEKDNAVSPMHYVSKSSPPFLILHGTADQMVPFAQSLELRDALLKNKINVILQPFPDATHGDPIILGNPAVFEMVKTFFDKYLRHQKTTIELLPASAVSKQPH